MKTTDFQFDYIIGPDGTKIAVPRRIPYTGDWLTEKDLETLPSIAREYVERKLRTWVPKDEPKDEKLTSDTIDKLGEILEKEKEVPFKENMNAKCFCDHSMAQHKRGGGPCGACKCGVFTEKLVEKCRFCGELLSIRTAPDDKVTRLSYSSVAGNYAHLSCLRDDAAKKKKTPERKSWLPPPIPVPPGPKLPPPGHPAQKKAMEGITFDKENIGVLSSILFKAGVYEIDGSIANEADWDSDELSLLAKLDAAV